MPKKFLFCWRKNDVLATSQENPTDGILISFEAAQVSGAHLSYEHFCVNRFQNLNPLQSYAQYLYCSLYRKYAHCQPLSRDFSFWAKMLCAVRCLILLWLVPSMAGLHIPGFLIDFPCSILSQGPVGDPGFPGIDGKSGPTVRPCCLYILTLKFWKIERRRSGVWLRYYHLWLSFLQDTNVPGLNMAVFAERSITSTHTRIVWESIVWRRKYKEWRLNERSKEGEELSSRSDI